MSEEQLYFEARVSITQNDDGKWIGRTRFVRKDTNEEIGCGKTLVADNREQLETRIHEAAEGAIRTMRRPADWKSKARLVLIKCLAIQNKITEFGRVLDTLQSGKITVNDADEAYLIFWTSLVDEVVSITKEIDMLTRDERRELLLSRDEVFANPIDPWNLDDLSGREEIFRFFSSPTKDEIDLHEEQSRRMKLALVDSA